MTKKSDADALFEGLKFDEMKAVGHALGKLAVASPHKRRKLPNDRTGVFEVDADGGFRERRSEELVALLKAGSVEIPIAFNTHDAFDLISLIRHDIASAVESNSDCKLTSSLADEMSVLLTGILGSPDSDDDVSDRLPYAGDLITKAVWLGMAYQRFLLRKAEGTSKYGTNHRQKLKGNRKARTPKVTFEEIEDRVCQLCDETNVTVTTARTQVANELKISLSTVNRIRRQKAEELGIETSKLSDSYSKQKENQKI